MSTPEPPNTRHVPKVIVAEDDRAFRTALERYLSKRGYDARMVVNGRQLLDAVRAEDFDLVITDINMPELDGIEVLRHLARTRSHLPVIAISSGGLVDGRLLLANAEALGAAHTLRKPFALAELDRAIDDVLGNGADRNSPVPA